MKHRMRDRSKKTENPTNKKKRKNYYFTQEVQDKIELFQKTECLVTKNKIYDQHISDAFNNLVQSLIAVYKFKSTNEDINHLKADCVSFLFETIYKWKPEKGKKAFSYFNVVAKNFLTIQSRRMLKNSNRNVYLDDEVSLSSSDKKSVYEKEYQDGEAALENSLNKYNRIIEIIDFISENLSDANDIKCCYAIKKIFTDINDIEFFNKRAVFVYLREISGLNSTELSSSLSSIRKIYKKNVGLEKQFNIFEFE